MTNNTTHQTTKRTAKPQDDRRSGTADAVRRDVTVGDLIRPARPAMIATGLLTTLLVVTAGLLTLGSSGLGASTGGATGHLAVSAGRGNTTVAGLARGLLGGGSGRVTRAGTRAGRQTEAGGHDEERGSEGLGTCSGESHEISLCGCWCSVSAGWPALADPESPSSTSTELVGESDGARRE